MNNSISPLYRPCSFENETCTFEGAKSVAYLANNETGSIYYRNPHTSILCNNASFGGNDPAIGTNKKCMVAPIPTDIDFANGIPNNFSLCAQDGGICAPRNDGRPIDVLYGGGGNFVYANVTSTPCNTTVFGDPAPSFPKACYWRNTPANLDLAASQRQPSLNGTQPLLNGTQPSTTVTPFTPLTPAQPIRPHRRLTPGRIALYVFIALFVLAFLIIVIFVIIKMAKQKDTTQSSFKTIDVYRNY